MQLLCQQTPLLRRHTGGVLHAMVRRVNRKAGSGKKDPIVFPALPGLCAAGQTMPSRRKGTTVGVK